MKKNGQMRNSSEEGGKISTMRIVRAYLKAILLIHRNLGAPRIIAAYLFAFSAFLSLLFTIRLPVTSDFLPPSEAAKAQSRAISGFMMILNILVFGIILNWKKSRAVPMAIRTALIGLVLYLDTFLIRIVYILIRDGAFF